VLPRSAYRARAAVAAQASADGAAYPKYRRAILLLGRALRPLWDANARVETDVSDGDHVSAAAGLCRLSRVQRRHLETLARTGAAAHLDRWFEGDALKAALAFDVCIHGVSPHEAGSALLLLWRAGQETAGLQGATAQVRGGPLTLAVALTSAAQEAGVVVRTGVDVARIAVENGRASGVTLSGGETVAATAVLSSLGRAATLAFVPPDAIPLGDDVHGRASHVGCAKIVLGLNGAVPIAGLNAFAERGRLLVAERPETAAEAKGAALAGRIPDELVLEVTVPSVSDNSAAPIGHSAVSILVPFMPARIDEGWEAQRPKLMKRVIATLEAYAPGIGERIVESVVLTPDDLTARYGTACGTPPTVGRLLATYATRVRTPVRGVYLCGSAGEPVDVVSGTAGRAAASLMLADNPASGETRP
jgi:phytoene dehydrogenase-like protein